MNDSEPDTEYRVTFVLKVRAYSRFEDSPGYLMGIVMKALHDGEGDVQIEQVTADPRYTRVWDKDLRIWVVDSPELREDVASLNALIAEGEEPDDPPPTREMDPMWGRDD